MANREYSDTGYSPIDAEHRAISERLHDFIELVNGGKLTLVQAAMQELGAAVAGHFAHEERLMAQYRFPNESRHCEAHGLFLADVADHATQLTLKGLTPEFRRWAVTRPVGWFRFHIMANDIELGLHLLREASRDAALGERRLA